MDRFSSSKNSKRKGVNWANSIYIAEDSAIILIFFGVILIRPQQPQEAKDRIMRKNV